MRHLVTALALAGLFIAPGVAGAREPLPTVVQDDALLLHRPAEQVRATLEDLHRLGVETLRITAQWSLLTPGPESEVKPDFDAADPAAYEQARFEGLDRAIRIATELGFGVIMDVGYYAPRWASSGIDVARRPKRIRPADFADFAVMLGRRYDGSFVPGAGGVQPPAPGAEPAPVFPGLSFPGPVPRQAGPAGAAGSTALPRVGAFSLYNEPNHPAFLEPQWRRDRGRVVPASPHRYRDMVLRAYPALKQIRPDAGVLVGGTSSTGSYSGRGKGPVPPLRFLRALACVDSKLQPLRSLSCRGFTQLPGDGWSHHPYSLQTVPDAPVRGDRPDDVPMSGLAKLASTLRRLVAMGRIAPRLADIYITEYGYESNPPTTLEPFTQGDQARFLAWSEFLAWRNPAVKMFAQFLVRDTPPAPTRVSESTRRPFGDWGSGLRFADGRPKLALVAFEAGLFVRRASGGKIILWGRLRPGTRPQRVRLEVKHPGGAWRPLPSVALGGRVAATTVTTTPDGVLLRRATAAPDRGARYRFVYGAGGSSLTVRAVTPSPSRPPRR